MLRARVTFSWARLTNYRSLRRRLLRAQGYPLNLDAPQSFNELIVHRKIFNRNPLFPELADKIQVRSFVEERLGARLAQEIVIPTVFSGRAPSRIPFDAIDFDCIIKPNHSCRQHMVYSANVAPVRADVIRNCRTWLRRPYGISSILEWAYLKIQPAIIVDEVDKKRDWKYSLKRKIPYDPWQVRVGAGRQFPGQRHEEKPIRCKMESSCDSFAGTEGV